MRLTPNAVWDILRGTQEIIQVAASSRLSFQSFSCELLFSTFYLSLSLVVHDVTYATTAL